MQREHGVYKLDVYPGNILAVDAIGPWNLETVQHYQDDVVHLVKGFNGQPWRNVAILRSETLFTPEVAGSLKEHLLWRKNTNFMSDTVILADSVSKFVSKSQIQSMYDSVGMTVFFADSVDQALNDKTVEFKVLG